MSGIEKSKNTQRKYISIEIFLKRKKSREKKTEIAPEEKIGVERPREEPEMRK